jgi:hypothetical protein
METKCSVEGCEDRARSKGLCQKHYVKLWRSGTLESLLPEKYGSKTKHPLYITWSKSLDKMCDEWKDFWRFVDEIGDRPTDGKYRIKRIDESLPYSPSNCVWKKVEVSQKPGETLASYHKRRDATRVRPKTYTHAKGLKANHGMTMDEYAAMFEAQKGLCAMCGRPERREGKDGKPMRLAVDHCHKSLKRRALLCAACNTALGLLEDSVDLFKAGIAYLEGHSE